ncbi:GNAT family N-acetyltransferase [Facilibium subflavum]|uniref:GNAT family N-acetyltransferase n=1 Tax=Facilibium subflavum TaxID=2219058 RepID=UPI000E657096|nr:N-acetyltransferase [Facilibium subflavum]
MESFHIRQAMPCDVKQLLNIEYTCFSSDRISVQQMQYLVSKAKSSIFLVLEDTRKNLAGYVLAFAPKNKVTARIYSLAILPQFRGQHLASYLLQHLFEMLNQKGYQYCHLEVRESDEKTQKLYQKFGFVQMKKLLNYYEDGEHAWRMRVVLKS